MATGGRKKGPQRFDSIDSLRRRVPYIVKRLNQEPALALRAAANPLLALRELDIEVSDTLAREVELRLRFRPEQVGRLKELRAEIHEAAGEAFDVDDPAAVHATLFERLNLTPPGKAVRQRAPAETGAADLASDRGRHALAYTWQPPGTARKTDPLDPLRGEHPVMAPLLEYRALQATQPPFAPPEIVDRLKTGRVSLPGISVRARLKRGTTPDQETERA